MSFIVFMAKLCIFATMELYIYEKTRIALGREVGLLILQRGDMVARDILDQLHKTTDRAYTMLGLLVTGFTAITGFVFALRHSWAVMPLLVLWVGLGVSLFVLFMKAVWVNLFCPLGKDPGMLIHRKNLARLEETFSDSKEVARRYELNLIYDSIEQCQFCIDSNEKALNARVEGLYRTMVVLKVTVLLTAVTTAVTLAAYFFL